MAKIKMIIKEQKRLNRLRGKYYDNNIDSCEYDDMIDLENTNKEDKYWDTDGNTKW
jgi:hypothetical protein